MTDRYVEVYGKTRKELENDEMVARFHENYAHLTQLAQIDDLDNSVNDMRQLDNVIYKQAMDLEQIGNQMKGKFYDKDGLLKVKELDCYLRVLKQFSEIYEKTNTTLARRYMVHRY